MSIEEEVELRDMVAQTLETNGCLPKIRAQLRANLFLALDENTKVSKQQPLLNTKLKSYLESPEGQLMFCLVREFLEYFDLDFTASVFEPESYIGNYYKYEGRQKVIEDLGLKAPEENFTGPLLLQVVKIAQIKSKTLKINLTNINGDELNGHSERKLIENGDNIQNLDSTYVKKDENDDTFNGTSSIEEDVNGDASQKSNEDENSLSPEQETSPESKSKSEDKKSRKNKLELPPLQLNKARGSDLLPSLYKKSKEYDFEIKDDYEEDFMSGSEIEFSQSKIESPKPLFEELQCSERTSNATSGSRKIASLSDNKLNSDIADTNLSVDSDT